MFGLRGVGRGRGGREESQRIDGRLRVGGAAQSVFFCFLFVHGPYDEVAPPDRCLCCPGGLGRRPGDAVAAVGSGDPTGQGAMWKGGERPPRVASVAAASMVTAALTDTGTPAGEVHPPVPVQRSSANSAMREFAAGWQGRALPCPPPDPTFTPKSTRRRFDKGCRWGWGHVLAVSCATQAGSVA